MLDGGMDAWVRDGHAVTDVVPAERTGKLAPLKIRKTIVDAAVASSFTLAGDHSQAIRYNEYSLAAATATAEPPEDPPQVIAVFQGLRVRPKTSLKVCEPSPNSGVLVLPMTIAPAFFMRCTNSASARSQRTASARAGTSEARWCSR